MEIKHVQLVQVLKIADTLNHVFAEHEDPQGGNRVQMSYLLDLVIVEVKENETG
jgi:hypothetical protein